ncbi:CinA family protein, partial [Litoribrevibacter euphylliae]
SSWFNAGIVSYSNDAKRQFLNVSEDSLERYGAVSQQVVEAMAKGAADLNFGQVSVAVSGVAGPGGGTSEKPVGTVWIGWSVNEIISSSKFHFEGNREQIRYQTLIAALEGLLVKLN